MLLKSLEGARCSGFKEKDWTDVSDVIRKDTDLVWLVKILERYWLAKILIGWLAKRKGKSLPWCLHWAGLWWSWSQCCQSIYKWRLRNQNNLIPLLMELHLVLWNPVFYLFWTSGMRKNTHVQYWLESSLLISTAPSNKSQKVTRKLLLVVTTTEL